MGYNQLNQFIENALREDIGSGDHTTLSCIPENATGKAVLLAKQEGILAGTEIAREVFFHFDPAMKIDMLMPDGTRVSPGDKPMMVAGSQRSILQTERLVLNIIQRMSGIATTTSKYVEAVKGTGTRILDTRKTTPNFRFLEKEAVRIGGGVNHRHGLYDMILIKDNHIDYAGGVAEAIERAYAYVKANNLDIKIEVEARTLEDVRIILETGKAFRILLDNFTPERIAEAVQLIGHQVETEASGGINLQNIREYALAGVDYISVGALTHQINSLDFSLKAIS
jgi:nicotinate-nucleotide pyrophosphorylase (carboxylating)